MARLEDTEREALKGLKRKLSEQFSRARAEVQATVDAVKGEQKLIKAKEAKQRLFELEVQTKAELAPAGMPIPLKQLGGGKSGRDQRARHDRHTTRTATREKRVRVKVGEEEVLATVTNPVGLA